MNRAATVVGVALLLVLTPIIESALVGNLPGMLASIPLYPLVALVIIRRSATWGAVSGVLIGAAWRDIFLMTSSLATLTGTAALLGVFVALSFVLTNRAAMVAVVTTVFSYLAYVGGMSAASAIATSIRPAFIGYDIPFSSIAVGILCAGLLPFIIRDQHQPRQLVLPFS